MVTMDTAEKDTTSPPRDRIDLRPGQAKRLTDLKTEQEKQIFRLGVLARQHHQQMALVNRELDSLQGQFAALVQEFAKEHEIDLSGAKAEPDGRRWAYDDQAGAYRLVPDGNTRLAVVDVP
jgi:hypothetical protein